MHIMIIPDLKPGMWSRTGDKRGLGAPKKEKLLQKEECGHQQPFVGHK
jgi:hypothetical protein